MGVESLKVLSFEIESADEVEELSNILMRLLSIDGINPPIVMLHNVPDNFDDKNYYGRDD